MAIYLGGKEVGITTGMPTKEIEITENGVYNVKEYATARVFMGGEPVVIDLPEIFNTASFIFDFKINEEKCLLGCNLTSSGLWLYNTKSKEIIQLYNTGRWDNFWQLNETTYLVKDSTYGFIVYNSIDDSIKYIETKNDAEFYGSIYYMQQVSQNKWLLTSSSSNSGLCLFNLETNTVIRIYNKGYAYLYWHSVTNTKYIAGHAGSSTPLILYNSEDDSVKEIYEYGRFVENFENVGNKCVMSARTTAGILVYNSEDDSVIKVYDTGYAWEYLHKVSENKCLIAGDRAAATGLILLNLEDYSIKFLKDTGIMWSNVKQVTNEKFLISSSNTSGTANYGLYLYNNTDDTISTVLSGYPSGWDIFIQFDNLWIISGTYKSSSSANGAVLYNSIDDSCVRFYTSGNNFDIVEKKGDVFILSGSDKQINPRTIEYNMEDGSVKITKYYIGDF